MQAIVFDLDGTLWDTVRLCVKSWNEAIARHGDPRSPLKDEDLAGIMGLTREETQKKLFGMLDEESGRKLLETCFERELYYLEREGGTLYPGVAEGLAEISRSFDLALVSNCDLPYLDAFFSTTDFQRYFKDWECHGNTGKDKGSNLAELCRRKGYRKAAYVGDTTGDERAARFAGLAFWHVTYGFGKAQSPDHTFHRFSELVSFVKSL